jgi:hypothetical protein
MSVAMKKTKKNRVFLLRDADLIWASSGETSKKRLFFEGFSGRCAIKCSFGGRIYRFFEVSGVRNPSLIGKSDFEYDFAKKGVIFMVLGVFPVRGVFEG